MKEREQTTFSRQIQSWSAKGRVGIKAPQSPKFYFKNCGFTVDFLLSSARLCTDHTEIWHETVHCSTLPSAKFERNRWKYGLYSLGDPNFPLWSDLEFLSVFTTSEPAKGVKKLMRRIYCCRCFTQPEALMRQWLTTAWGLPLIILFFNYYFLEKKYEKVLENSH